MVLGSGGDTVRAQRRFYDPGLVSAGNKDERSKGKAVRFTKLMIGAAAVGALALAGCSSDKNKDTAESGDVQSGAVIEEVVTEEGLGLVEAYSSCEDIAGLVNESVPGVLDGLELIVSSGGAEEATVCDWQNDDGGVLTAEVSPFEQTVPTADGVAEAGGTVVEAAKVTDAGGLVCSLPGEAETVVGVFPYGRAVVQFAGLEGVDQAKAVAMVEALLGL